MDPRIEFEEDTEKKTKLCFIKKGLIYVFEI